MPHLKVGSEEGEEEGQAVIETEERALSTKLVNELEQQGGEFWTRNARYEFIRSAESMMRSGMTYHDTKEILAGLRAALAAEYGE